jgi:hypothetical protein
MGQILNALARITNIACFNSLTDGSATITGSTSGTYVDITGFTLSFTKLGDATQSNVLALMVVGWRTNATPTSMRGAINFVSSDRDMVVHEITTGTSVHRNAIGFRIHTGVGAGVYSVRGRIRRNGGTGDMTIDASDTCCLVLAELPL